MYLSDILNILGINIKYNDIKINKIRTDSREVSSNDIFITINSGYKYIMDATSRGCNIIITDSNYINDNIIVIKVDNTIKVLGMIAKYIRSKYNGIVIGITGSCGKTTTKELLSYILSNKYKVLSTRNSLNNNIGVPNTLLELDNTYDYVVLELGTNHIGEIKYLSDIVKPNISIITNIGSSHIGNFGSKKNILKEKLSIGGLLFLNGEDKLLRNIDGIKVYKNDYNYDVINKINYYLVFKVCEYLNMSIDDIINIISNYKLNMSRMEITKYNNVTLIDDTYNASYESVMEGLKYISKYNNKLIILSDMLELGKYNYRYHYRVNKYINKLSNSTVISIGKYIDSDIRFKDINRLIEYIKYIDYTKYDVIYVKGAHKFELYKIVGIIRLCLKK